MHRRQGVVSMPLDDALTEEVISKTVEQAACQTVACDVVTLSKVAARLTKATCRHIRTVIYWGKPAAEQLEVSFPMPRLVPQGRRQPAPCVQTHSTSRSCH